MRVPTTARIARLTDPDTGIVEAANFVGVYALPFTAGRHRRPGRQLMSSLTPRPGILDIAPYVPGRI
jgi:hypothetical protein